MSKAKTEQAPTPNVPMSIEDEIKKQLQAQKGHIGALPSNKIQLKNKEFSLPDGQKSAGPLEAIILDYVWAMVHYPGVYNSNNPQQPNCFAIGRETPQSGELRPHASIETPEFTDCKDCPKNEWKSAPTGNGKACKNQRRLIIIPPKFDGDIEPMTMYVSPAGLKHFDAYVTRLQNEHGLLPAQVVTEISFDPDQTYPLLHFKFLAKHENVAAAWAIRERSQDILFREVEIAEDSKKKAS